MTGTSAIVRIEITHHRLPLDPPFPAAWDPQPRAAFPATIVRVVDDAGHVGIGSGDAMYGFADYEQWFIGEDPLDLDRHHAVLANIDFHAGRPWPLDIALWDLAGQILDRPVWELVGGRAGAVRTYASSGVHRPVDEMGAMARHIVDLGFPALKVRFGRPDADDDLAAVRAVRDAVGSALEVMVDCNQGWRMPWDTRPAWDVDTATAVATAVEAEDVYWIEEPLHRGDVAGLAELRRRVGIRVAGGELTREPYEFSALLAADCPRRLPARLRLHAGDHGLAPPRCRRRRRRQGVHAAHVGQRHRPAGQRPPHGRHRRCAVPRVPVRPAGVDDRPP